MFTIDQDTTPDGAVIYRPGGDLDALTVQEFRAALGEVAGCGKLVIDLAGVTFVDSAGLGALIGGIRAVRERGGDVVIAGGRPALVRLLQTTGFDRVVVIVDTIDEALGALADVLGPVPAADGDARRTW
jgi:anti-sigma B factor antagonist